MKGTRVFNRSRVVLLIGAALAMLITTEAPHNRNRHRHDDPLDFEFRNGLPRPSAPSVLPLEFQR